MSAQGCTLLTCIVHFLSQALIATVGSGVPVPAIVHGLDDAAAVCQRAIADTLLPLPRSSVDGAARPAIDGTAARLQVHVKAAMALLRWLAMMSMGACCGGRLTPCWLLLVCNAMVAAVARLQRRSRWHRRGCRHRPGPAHCCHRNPHATSLWSAVTAAVNDNRPGVTCARDAASAASRRIAPSPSSSTGHHTAPRCIHRCCHRSGW